MKAYCGDNVLGFAEVLMEKHNMLHPKIILQMISHFASSFFAIPLCSAFNKFSEEYDESSVKELI